jgi:hypothetical protein
MGGPAVSPTGVSLRIRLRLLETASILSGLVFATVALSAFTSCERLLCRPAIVRNGSETTHCNALRHVRARLMHGHGVRTTQTTHLRPPTPPVML